MIIKYKVKLTVLIKNYIWNFNSSFALVAIPVLAFTTI